MGGWPQTGASLAPHRQRFGRRENSNTTVTTRSPPVFASHRPDNIMSTNSSERNERHRAEIVLGMAVTVIALFYPDGNKLDWAKPVLICWLNYWWFEKLLPLLAHRWLSHQIFVNLCETTRFQTRKAGAAWIARMIRTREQWQEVDCLVMFHDQFIPLEGEKEEQDSQFNEKKVTQLH